jgi:hypothetical protein
MFHSKNQQLKTRKYVCGILGHSLALKQAVENVSNADTRKYAERLGSDTTVPSVFGTVLHSDEKSSRLFPSLPSFDVKINEFEKKKYASVRLS